MNNTNTSTNNTVKNNTVKKKNNQVFNNVKRLEETKKEIDDILTGENTIRTLMIHKVQELIPYDKGYESLSYNKKRHPIRYKYSTFLHILKDEVATFVLIINSVFLYPKSLNGKDYHLKVYKKYYEPNPENAEHIKRIVIGVLIGVMINDPKSELYDTRTRRNEMKPIHSYEILEELCMKQIDYKEEFFDNSNKLKNLFITKYRRCISEYFNVMYLKSFLSVRIKTIHDNICASIASPGRLEHVQTDADIDFNKVNADDQQKILMIIEGWYNSDNSFFYRMIYLLIYYPKLSNITFNPGMLSYTRTNDLSGHYQYGLNKFNSQYQTILKEMYYEIFTYLKDGIIELKKSEQPMTIRKSRESKLPGNVKNVYLNPASNNALNHLTILNGGQKQYIKLQSGGRRLVRYGSRGGRYYIKKGNKVYVK